MKTIELHRTENHVILVTAIKFFDLKELVRFSSRENSNWSEKQEGQESSSFYQRATNDLRVKKIKRYIEETLIYPNKSEILFPSSLIINVNIDTDDLISSDGIIDLPLTEIEKNSCLIVDGQHRMKAMLELYNDLQKKHSNELNKIESYKFNCTILVNYDLWEQAKIFASVNFNQKPVDRSLYYDIFGEMPENQRDKSFSNLYVAHELGKYLNSSNKSPLKGFVKNFNSKNGFISQAFLTQSILMLLGPRSNWGNIVEDYKNGGVLFKQLPVIFAEYFSALKKQMPNYWPKSISKEDAQILSKTNGLGALIKLLGKIDAMLKIGLYPNYKTTNLLDLSSEELEKLFMSIFEIFNENTPKGIALAKKYFGEESRYFGGGSAGLQNQLFRELANEIGIPASDVNR
nr:DGQHR domain-containing protein [uncultured Pedobacter sp.]